MEKAYILSDLGYGDSGKGAITATLARSLPSPLIVRYNGGPQAGHNVIDNGRHHTFSQFGAGTFTLDAETHYSKHALFNPLNLIKEEEGLRRVGVFDAFKRFSVAPMARVITPFHIEANRHREASRGAKVHGTCAQGVGETMMGWLKEPEMTVYAEDLWNSTVLRYKLEFWRSEKREDIEIMGGTPSEIFDDNELIDTYVWTVQQLTARIHLYGDLYLGHAFGHRPVIFEGAQGILLDEWFGFHPHTTWSTTTTENARDLLNGFDNVESIGITRSYMTRHGQGPFVTEDPELKFDEPHNEDSSPQGSFRRGHLDLVALKYAIEVSGGIDSIALTHCDRIESTVKACTSYEVGEGQMPEIPVGIKGDLEASERTTSMLFTAVPVYDDWDGAKFVDNLESALDRPVAMTRSAASEPYSRT